MYELEPQERPWPTISYPRPSPLRHHLFPSSLAASSLHRQHLPLDLLRIEILLLLRPANVLVSSAVASSSSGARTVGVASQQQPKLVSTNLDPGPIMLLVASWKTFCFPWTRCAAAPRALLLPAAASLLLLCCSSACGVCWQTGIRWRCSKLVISWSSVPLLWIT